MKKLILLSVLLIFACSSGEDEDCREITGMGRSCNGSECTYTIDLESSDYPEDEIIIVNETTWYYYDELWQDNEIVCWEGEQ